MSHRLLGLRDFHLVCTYRRADGFNNAGELFNGKRLRLHHDLFIEPHWHCCQNPVDLHKCTAGGCAVFFVESNVIGHRPYLKVTDPDFFPQDFCFIGWQIGNRGARLGQRILHFGTIV